MKKFLLVSMIVATAFISAFSAELKLSGDAYVAGTMNSNKAYVEEDAATYNYYDYDFNLKAAIVLNEQASVNFKLTYDKAYATGPVTKGDTTTTGSFLAVENAYITYKFNTGTVVDTGIMPGTKWATNFNDTETNEMRIKVVQKIGEEITLFAIIQKNAEDGAASPNTKDAEKNDSDTYYLAAIIKAGPLALKPLVAYKKDGVQQSATETDPYNIVTMVGMLGVNLDVDMLGFEGEFDYYTIDYDDHGTVDSAKMYGWYGNVFLKIDMLKFGLLYAYGTGKSTDGETLNLSLGDDFNAVLVADDINKDGSGLSGVTVYKVYAEAKIDNLTAGLSAAYIANNDETLVDKDWTGTEIDAKIAYAIDANVSYILEGGYLMLSKYGADEHDADAYAIRHKIAVKF